MEVHELITQSGLTGKNACELTAPAGADCHDFELNGSADPVWNWCD